MPIVEVILWNHITEAANVEGIKKIHSSTYCVIDILFIFIGHFWTSLNFSILTFAIHTIIVDI